MKQIAAERVYRNNSNIRKFSDVLWRELRKLNKLKRRSVTPDPYTNEMMAEIFSLQTNPHSDFVYDVEKFIATKLSEREGVVFRLFLFGGNIKQKEIAAMIGNTRGEDQDATISQSTVNNELQNAITQFKEYYYGDINEQRSTADAADDDTGSA
jgi:hypothetical protein